MQTKKCFKGTIRIKILFKVCPNWDWWYYSEVLVSTPRHLTLWPCWLECWSPSCWPYCWWWLLGTARKVPAAWLELLVVWVLDRVSFAASLLSVLLWGGGDPRRRSAVHGNSVKRNVLSLLQDNKILWRNCYCLSKNELSLFCRQIMLKCQEDIKALDSK